MLYAGLDLSRKRLDIHLLDGEGEAVDVGAAPPDGDGLLGLTRRLDRRREPILAAIESMNGARFVHDRLELAGWQVEIADGQKVKASHCWPARPTGSTPGYWPSSLAASWCRQCGCPTRVCARTLATAPGAPPLESEAACARRLAGPVVEQRGCNRWQVRLSEGRKMA